MFTFQSSSVKAYTVFASKGSSGNSPGVLDAGPPKGRAAATDSSSPSRTRRARSRSRRRCDSSCCAERRRSWTWLCTWASAMILAISRGFR